MGSSPFTRTKACLAVGQALFVCGRRDKSTFRYPHPKPLPSGEGLEKALRAFFGGHALGLSCWKCRL